MVRILLVITGLLLILFRKPFAKICLRSQNKAFNFEFGDDAVALVSYLNLLIGATAVAIGILVMSGII